MERMAIIVDGTDRGITDGTVGFAAGPVRQPRRPLAGLAIAIVTALVTMGAMGPRPPEAGGPEAAVCAPASPSPDAVLEADDTPAAVAASPMPWWLLPQVAEWVDPATGRSRQAPVDRDWQVVHARHLAR
jgi:hypothetical protein